MSGKVFVMSKEELFEKIDEVLDKYPPGIGYDAIWDVMSALGLEEELTRYFAVIYG